MFWFLSGCRKPRLMIPSFTSREVVSDSLSVLFTCFSRVAIAAPVLVKKWRWFPGMLGGKTVSRASVPMSAILSACSFRVMPE